MCKERKMENNSHKSCKKCIFRPYKKYKEKENTLHIRIIDFCDECVELFSHERIEKTPLPLPLHLYCKENKYDYLCES